MSPTTNKTKIELFSEEKGTAPPHPLPQGKYIQLKSPAKLLNCQNVLFSLLSSRGKFFSWKIQDVRIPEGKFLPPGIPSVRTFRRVQKLLFYWASRVLTVPALVELAHCLMKNKLPF
jgi:hypothetical protein